MLRSMPLPVLHAHTHAVLAAGLRPADWLVLALYAAVLIGAGIYFSVRKKKSTTQDYFLAGRSMPVWAVTISTLATAQSAATFIGVPEDAYKGNLTYLSTNIGNVLAAIVIATVFLPAFYRLGVQTPYQLLQTRFGPGARTAASIAYMIGRTFASGSRVFLGAIPVAIAIYGNRDPSSLAVAIAAFMVFGILYTLWGGLESAIWTDILQVSVYVGAAVVAIIVLWSRIPAPAADVFAALRSGMPDGSSKLALVRPGIDPSAPNLGFSFATPFTLITACTGWMLLTLAAFGTDQDMTQRLLSCKSNRRAGWSMISFTLVTVPVVLIFATVGLLLWVFYTQHSLMGRDPGTIATISGSGGDATDIFLRFILNEMPLGAAGLMIAGVLAAGPAGINASLNSMAGAFVNDVYKPLIRPAETLRDPNATDDENTRRAERHYVRVGRFAVVAWGLVLGLVALGCVWWQKNSGETLIQFVLGVMGFAYAGLLAVFLTALLTKRGSTTSAIAALLVGFAIITVLQPPLWRVWTTWTPWTNEHLNRLTLASPWRLCLGFSVAMLICLIPRGKRDSTP
jgi:solute:Na+ symporter, SSS family